MGEKIRIQVVEVIESDLYAVWGEDSELICYNLHLSAVGVDGNIYMHKYQFKGHFVDDDGVNRPNFASKPSAHMLALKIKNRGEINLSYWNKTGKVVDLNKWEEKLQEAWSDFSDIA